LNLRSEALGYLAACEPTGNGPLDALGEYVRQLAEAPPTAERNLEFANQWGRFHRLYGIHFTEAHDSLLSGADLKSQLAELRKSDDWWEFEALGMLPGFDAAARERILDLTERIERLDCNTDVAELIKSAPACCCGFSFELAERAADLPLQLSGAVNSALARFRDTLRDRLDEIRELEAKGFNSKAVEGLVALLRSKKESRRFSEDEIQIIRSLPERPKPLADADLSEIDAALESLQ
jgi:uncharacterized protein (UPF0335 family)